MQSMDSVPRMPGMADKLKYPWRLAMTGLCFALFGLGGLLLTSWFHILCWLQPDSTKRRQSARTAISASFRIFLATLKWSGVAAYNIQGAALLKQDQGCLVLANHPTLIDYVLLASVIPQCDCMVKEALQRNPFMSGVIKAADYLINGQAEPLLSESKNRLKAGDTLLIFPEGTRSRSGEALKLQRGAANLAVRSGCDIRIVHIHCSESFLSKGSKWYQIPRVKPVLSIEVRQRFSATDFIQEGDNSPALAARRLNQHLTSALTADNSHQRDK